MYNTNSLLGTISYRGEVTNPECGSGYSVPQGEGLSFFCRPALHGRYVTIRSLLIKTALTMCEVEVYSERRGTLHISIFFFVDSDDNKSNNVDAYDLKSKIHRSYSSLPRIKCC